LVVAGSAVDRVAESASVTNRLSVVVSANKQRTPRTTVFAEST
jgi:hypothetical protein